MIYLLNTRLVVKFWESAAGYPHLCSFWLFNFFPMKHWVKEISWELGKSACGSCCWGSQENFWCCRGTQPPAWNRACFNGWTPRGDEAIPTWPSVHQEFSLSSGSPAAESLCFGLVGNDFIPLSFVAWGFPQAGHLPLLLRHSQRLLNCPRPAKNRSWWLQST